MRRDRDGSIIEDDEDQDDLDPPAPHVCRRGWIDPDADHPRPCPMCKPHLLGKPLTAWPRAS